MNLPKNYMEEALHAEIKNYHPAENRLGAKGMPRVLHAVMGLCTEAAEALDAVKKHVFYGKELDHTNLKEELGDVFWYTAILADELGLSFEEIQKTNIKKLSVRYKKGFTEESAVKRDLEKERKILCDPFRIATNKDLEEMRTDEL